MSGTDCEFCTPQQTLDRQRAAEKQRTDALGEDYNAANKPVEVASGGRTLEEAMRRARESA